MYKIEYQWLKRIGACSPGLAWFEARFPDGKVVTPDFLREVFQAGGEEGDEWLEWLVDKLCEARAISMMDPARLALEDKLALGISRARAVADRKIFAACEEQNMLIAKSRSKYCAEGSDMDRKTYDIVMRKAEADKQKACDAADAAYADTVDKLLDKYVDDLIGYAARQFCSEDQSQGDQHGRDETQATGRRKKDAPPPQGPDGAGPSSPIPEKRRAPATRRKG
jgi:hypothetical protein